MQNSIYKISLALLLFAPLNAGAQILAPDADYSDTANYLLPNGPDSLFFFNVDNSSTYIIVDTQNYKGYTIQWDEYSHLTGYDSISAEEKISFAPDTVGKGYRLTLRGADTVVRRCWVFKNDFDMKITSKDEGDTLWTNSYLYCDRLELIDVKRKDAYLKYHHPVDYDTLFYEMGYKSEWEKEQNVAEGNIIRVSKVGDKQRHRLVNPYWEGMWYTNIVTDSAGLERQDKVYVRSIVPKAEIKDAEYIKRTDKFYYPDRSERYYDIYAADKISDEESAPAKYRFTHDSKNAHSYYWVFGDTSKPFRSTEDSVIHTYNYWGEFEAYLVAEHTFSLINKTCTDSTEPKEISIAKPTLHAPGAISPPNGNVPYWRFFDVSIADFEVVIFNRHGKKVHDFKGNINDWNGWDGKYRDSERVVPTGVYFYVVKKISTIPNIDPENDEEFNPEFTSENTEYRGFIHVFNTEN